jgi:hypothetical protein
MEVASQLARDHIRVAAEQKIRFLRK